MLSLKRVLLQGAQSFRSAVQIKTTLQHVRWITQPTNLRAKIPDDKSDQETKEPSFEIHPGYLKFKERQLEYQVQDGKPIWQKKPTDLLLFGLTWLLMFIAVGMQMKMVYDMSGFGSANTD